MNKKTLYRGVYSAADPRVVPVTTRLSSRELHGAVNSYPSSGFFAKACTHSHPSPQNNYSHHYWSRSTVDPHLTSCARGDTICPRPSPHPVGAQGPRAPQSRRNVPILSYPEYVPTLTAAAALRVKAALSKAVR